MADENIKDVIKQILAAEAESDEKIEETTAKVAGEEKTKNTTAANNLKEAPGSKDPDNLNSKVPMKKVESDPKTVTDPSKISTGGNKVTGAEKGEKKTPGSVGEAVEGETEVKAEGEKSETAEEEVEEDVLDTIKAAGKKYLSEKLEESSKALAEKAKASIKAVVEGVTDLSDENKSKVSTLFEATLSEAIKSAQETAAAAFHEVFEEVSKEHYDKLSEQIDTYLSYVAQEWLKENKLAVYHGTRQQIAENFIEEMREVFERHDLEIPESKTNLLEKAVAHIEKLEQDVAAQVSAAAELTKQVNEMKKAAVVESITKGMIKTQAEKAVKLAEEIAYVDDESFKKKFAVIVEHYFPQTKAGSESLLEDVSGEKNEKSEKKEVPEGSSEGVVALAQVITNLAPKLKIAK